MFIYLSPILSPHSSYYAYGYDGDMMEEGDSDMEDEVETESTETSTGFFLSGSLVVGIVTVLSFSM